MITPISIEKRTLEVRFVVCAYTQMPPTPLGVVDRISKSDINPRFLDLEKIFNLD